MGKLAAALEEVLRRQGQSLLQASLLAASLTGLGAQAVAQRLVTFAAAELEDFHRLAQKPHTLGVLPRLVIDVPAASGSENSPRQLIDDETAGLAALHAVIPLTRTTPRIRGPGTPRRAHPLPQAGTAGISAASRRLTAAPRSHRSVTAETIPPEHPARPRSH